MWIRNAIPALRAMGEAMPDETSVVLNPESPATYDFSAMMQTGEQPAVVKLSA